MVWANILKDPEDVKQVIADASGPLFLVYYADWCPDCQNAKPVLEEVLGTETYPKAVQVMVGERAVWKSKDNVFRQEPFKISSIPTVVRLDKGKEAGRLVESEVIESGRLAEFVA